ncbi:MAG: bifunctional (p)ppGpp synthetase/guanosine-3',5'-bis(diphosphate) 3'-pyrophosphohydrolase [Candidatus Omnitrophota bacterium]
MTPQADTLLPIPTSMDIEDDFPILELILRNYLPENDILRIRKAYFFAYAAHSEQKRVSGEPYIVHPISVAETLAEYQLDADTIMAGLLHDVLEDTGYKYEDLKREFGENVATLVQQVTNVSKNVNQISSADRNETELENLRRMLVSTAKDPHALVIKLADRLHNMRTLQHLPRSKQIHIAKNTLRFFAPLAHRLGLGQIKWELEDRCLMFLNPEKYRYIKKKVSLKRREREEIIRQARRELEKALLDKGFHVSVEGRAKHFYSIYMKMVRENRSFSEIYDLIALRVICETIGECYAILGEVHTMWRQVEGRFKDYISNPKPNNYRSIHTTVLGPHGRMMEIQIRTQEMHQIAEHGIAAHWRYKESHQRRVGRDLQWLDLSTNLPDTQDPDDFLKSLSTDLFSDEVYCYTPKGSVIALPKNSTPIDFAYKIHTELGNRCGGAKVNGRIAPLNYSLKTGDVVEILSYQSSHPTHAWLEIVTTASARNKIRRYLLESGRDQLLKMGQHQLTQELKKAGYKPLEFYNSPAAEEIVESLDQKDLDDLFVNIGFGRISTKQVLFRLLKQKAKSQEPAKEADKKPEPASDESAINKTVVHMGDIDDIMYRRARCCSPLPGDEIIGFVTRGRGVTIHKTTCSNLKYARQDNDRIMPLFWEGDHKERISVSLEIRARDRHNLLSDLSQMISSTGTNITGCQSSTTSTQASFLFDVDVTSINHLNTIMQQLLGIEGVKTVRRVRGYSRRNPRRKP